MRLRTIAWLFVFGSAICAGGALAYDCTGLPEWKRQAYYPADTEVQYEESAYVALENTKRDLPTQGDPWAPLGPCGSSGGGGGGGGGGATVGTSGKVAATSAQVVPRTKLSW